MMSKIIIYISIAAVVIGGATGLILKIQADAASRAVLIERGKVVAKANANIAERRATDAKFNRTDAMELCREAGLEWYADEGRSYCRVKPAG